MRKRRERPEYVDDGKRIADMNVEGMPWYRPRQSTDAKDGERIELTDKEAKYFLWGVMKAALLISLIFIGAYFLFILFLDVVVFKN